MVLKQTAILPMSKPDIDDSSNLALVDERAFHGLERTSPLSPGSNFGSGTVDQRPEPIDGPGL